MTADTPSDIRCGRRYDGPRQKPEGGLDHAQAHGPLPADSSSVQHALLNFQPPGGGIVAGGVVAFGGSSSSSSRRFDGPLQSVMGGGLKGISSAGGDAFSMGADGGVLASQGLSVFEARNLTPLYCSSPDKSRGVHKPYSRARMCVCVFVCARVRVCVYVCVYVCVVCVRARVCVS